MASLLPCIHILVHAANPNQICIVGTVYISDPVADCPFDGQVMTLELEDDGQAAFNAALAFLDEFEPLVAARDEDPIDTLAIAVLNDVEDLRLDGAEATGWTAEGAQPPVEAANSSSKGKKKRQFPRTGDADPNRARTESRRELVYLRNTVAEMEMQLQELKQAGDGNSSASSATVKSAARLLTVRTGNPRVQRRTSRSGVSDNPQFVWEEIATRQYAQRHKAELENVKLRIMLEGQIKVAKNLESVLKKRSTTQIHDLYGDSSMPLAKRTNLSHSDEDDAEIFDKLLADLDKSILEVDAIFEANGLSKTEDSFQDAIVRKTKRNGIYLEVFANKTMPFEINAMSNAVWLHMANLREQMPSRTYYGRQPKMMETTDDTIVERFQIELSLKRTNAHFSVHHTMRRFIEEDRVLIAWRQIYEPTEFSSQPTSGIRFYEKGFILLKRSTTRSPEFTLMQTCFIMTPERFGSNSWNDNMIGRLSNFLVDTTAGHIYFSHQMIENFLLDEALKRQE